MSDPRKQSDKHNLIIAAALSFIVIIYWDLFIEAPRQKAEVIAMRAKAHVEEQVQKEAETAVQTTKPRPELLQESPRLPIVSDSLHGSIALKGLRIDDLLFAHYRETLDPDSPPVTLFSPANDIDGYFAEFGWTAPDKNLKVPGADTLWTADGAKLTPATPVTLSWKSPDGNRFTVRLAMDDKYMFTIEQLATDAGGKPLALQAYGYINRVWDTKRHPPLLVHEGPLGVFDTTLKETTYKKLTEEKDETFEASDGWLGVSDKYWLSVIVPAKASFTSHFSYYTSKGRDHYQVDYLSAAAPATTLHFFAGAKELTLLEQYETQYQIPLFDRAVDFGKFYWLAKPIFHLLAWFHSLVGNFGIAILLLTVLVKLLMYPLASKSFKSMSQMKVLQPRMAEIRERYKDDKMQMNQAILELYKREKVNPASGCLPIFIQIPVFLSLYNVLYVTIEMRHAPFFGWIHDLSAPDPTNFFTAFGLISWTPPLFLHLGLWPLLMCVTMIIQQHQSPPPPDPTQAKMMKVLPFFFLFLFSNVAAGLVIYWTWSNTLTILQQWHIKRSHGEVRARPEKKRRNEPLDRR